MAAKEAAIGEPHNVEIVRGPQGFGFNIKGTTQEGGTHLAINGRLYAPLQYVSLIDERGAAWEGGLRVWDRILAVNGRDVEGASHKQVVEHVLRGGASLNLTVVSVSAEEADRLQRIEDAMDAQAQGLGKKYKVAIPDFNEVNGAGGKGYTVFNVYVDGVYSTSRRYSEFAKLHAKLKARFRWFEFPPLPGKKMNFLSGGLLSGGPLEQRRDKLAVYIGTCFDCEEIFNFQASQEFLKANPAFRPKNADARSKPASRAVAPAPSEKSRRLMKQANAAPAQRPAAAVEHKPREPEVDVKVTMPNLKVLTITVPVKASTVADVQAKLLALLKLGPFAANIFRLFEAVDAEGQPQTSALSGDSFERLVDMDTPAAEVEGRLVLRRWLFTKSQETYGQEDPHFVKVLFEQVSQDVSSGRLFVKPGRRDVLKQMVEDNEQLKFVKTARKMPTYSGIKFPACQSDYPEEDSSVVVTVDLNRIIIQELDADGEPSTDADDVTVFTMDVIAKVRRKGDDIGFKYRTDDGEMESIVFNSLHAEYMEACIRRVREEMEWAKTPGKDNFFHVDSL